MSPVRCRAVSNKSVVSRLIPWTDISQSFSVEFQPENMVANVIPDDDFETDMPEALHDGAANIGELAIVALRWKFRHIRAKKLR